MPPFWKEEAARPLKRFVQYKFPSPVPAAAARERERKCSSLKINILFISRSKAEKIPPRVFSTLFQPELERYFLFWTYLWANKRASEWTECLIRNYCLLVFSHMKIWSCFTNGLILKVTKLEEWKTNFEILDLNQTICSTRLANSFKLFLPSPFLIPFLLPYLALTLVGR